MRIGLVGGGTGGHFYPLMAVASVLNESDTEPDLYYFGPSPYDKEELARQGIKYVFCPAGKVRRYFSVQNILDGFRIFFGFFVALFKLFIIYPDVIFSKGGYTSVPILLAARILTIPVVIHESDALPGRANIIARGQAKYIGIAYDDASKYFIKKSTALVGLPLRPQFNSLPEKPHEYLGIPQDIPLIYVTGGSQGAERLNTLIFKSLARLLPEYRIFHQIGPGMIEEYALSAKALIEDPELLDRYYMQSSVNAETVVALMCAASLIITRAGSTTLFEIARVGKPSIIIPIPEDVSRDQRTNAYAYARSGAATVLEEENLTPSLLIQEIDSIIKDPERSEKMSHSARSMHIEGAAQKLAEALLSIGIEHGS